MAALNDDGEEAANTQADDRDVYWDIVVDEAGIHMEAGEEEMTHSTGHSKDLLRCNAHDHEDEMDMVGAEGDHHPLRYDTDHTDRWRISANYPRNNNHREDDAVEEEDGRGASLTMTSSPPPFHDCASSTRSLHLPLTTLQYSILHSHDLSRTERVFPERSYVSPPTYSLYSWDSDHPPPPSS